MYKKKNLSMYEFLILVFIFGCIKLSVYVRCASPAVKTPKARGQYIKSARERFAN